MPRRLALLRGINVGGRVLPMAVLRELCAGLGWRDVETFIASGNVLFSATGTGAKFEAALEAAILERFGFQVPVLVRTRRDLLGCLAGNPFGEAARDAPNRLLLLLAKRPIAPDAAEALAARAEAGEKIARGGEGIWILFPGGIARSKLSPSIIDKLAGSPATGRNHRTVARLAEMMAR